MYKDKRDIFGALPPELKLILLCLQRRTTEKKPEIINAPLPGYNWDLFMRMAMHHRVYPLVYRYLSTSRHMTVPRDVERMLQQKSRETAAKALQMTGELLKVLRTMTEKGIRAVVLKGFPLGYRQYGDMALRPSRDLDILVWPEDLEKARKVIEAHGYAQTYPCFPETPGRLRHWMKTQHHIEYLHQDKEICLELHWKLGNQDMDLPLSEIGDRLTYIMLAGQPVLMPGTEELLLFLVLHGASHAWFRLRWLCDIAAILQQGGFSWERLYKLIKYLDMETLFNQAIILARDLLAAPVPDKIAAGLAQDRKAQQLVDMALPIIAADDFNPANLVMGKPFYFHHKRYQFGIRCGWKRKLAHIHGCFSPREKDIGLISLPDNLYFLYYLLRPLTWFGQRAAELAGK